MERHGFVYMSAATTEAPRVQLDPNDIIVFYTVTLPTAINGVHPSLVFNLDEMGAEMFADRKNVFVFVLRRDVPRNQRLEVGVPRTTRRCTLIACISLDGTTVCPAIITKTMTISSVVLAEGGYMSNHLKLFHADNSFMNNEVFGEWLTDVFLPEVERRRAELHATLGEFDDRAVLIMDGLKCHTMDPFMAMLESHRVTVALLVSHSSHLTQPLDLGIFWRVKNLIRSDTKYVIDYNELDAAMAEQMEAENTGAEIPPERGRLLAEYVLRILRSFEQATTKGNVRSAFAQMGVCFNIVDPNNTDRRVSYVNPATARAIVARFGVIPFPRSSGSTMTLPGS